MGWGDLQNLGSLGSAEVFKCLLNLGSVLITLIRRLGRTIDMMQMWVYRVSMFPAKVQFRLRVDTGGQELRGANYPGGET